MTPVHTPSPSAPALPVYTAQQVQQAERPLLDAGQGPELMRTAAHGLALVVQRILCENLGQVYGTTVTALVGPGNNGGDALFAAAELATRGAHTTAILLYPDAVHVDGLAAARSAGVRIETDWAPGSHAFTQLLNAHVVMDGIFGTGARPGLPQSLTRSVSAWLKASAPNQIRIAVDVPTGVDASTGQTDPHAIPATHTVTFGLMKLGVLTSPGAEFCGNVHLIDIGLPQPPHPAGYFYTHATVPQPEPSDHKYSRGVLGIVAGSQQFPGAAVLTATAAQNTGVGMIRVLGSDRVVDAVLSHVPEVVPTHVPTTGSVQAWVVGPGAPEEAHVRAVLEQAYENRIPVVVDAGALEYIEPGKTRDTWVLTPHEGEAKRLAARLGVDVFSDESTLPSDFLKGGTAHAANDTARAANGTARARALAEATGCCVLLKGPYTVVGEPDLGPVHLTPRGPARLATAGSGDVLAGIAGALLATLQPESASQSAAAAARAVLLHHQAAGRRALETAQNLARLPGA